MQKNFLTHFVFGLLIFLSACASDKPTWNAKGKWIDLFAKVQICNSGRLWEIGLTLNQSDFQVEGPTYLSFSDGEGGLIEIPGTFAGTLSGDSLKATGVYSDNTFKIELDFDLTHKDEILRGSFTSVRLSDCQNGSKDRVSGDVVFITESPEPVSKDSLEPNNLSLQAATLVSDQPLKNLTISKQDVDWFKFEVKATSQLLLELELLSNFPSQVGLFNQDQATLQQTVSESLETQANILPFERVLQKGVYYIAVSGGNDRSFKGKHNANGKYSLQLRLTELPDSNYEPNDTKSLASPIVLDFKDKLYMSRSDQGSVDVDWFRFEINESQLVLLDLLPQQDNAVYFSLQASNGFTILSDTFNGNNSYEVALDPDSYYLVLGSAQPSGAFFYDLVMNGSPIPDEAFEPNNSRPTATAMELDLEQTLFLYPGDEDWLSFSLTESKVVTFDVSEAKSDFSFELYQGSSTVFNSSQSVEGIQTRVLGAGDYYFRAFDAFANVSYPLSIKAVPIPDLALEPNNSFNTARPLVFPFIQKLALDTKDDEDWFSFELSEPQLITVSINKVGSFGHVSGEFFTSTGSPVGEFEVGDIPIHAFAFDAGLYFLNFYDEASTGFVFDTILSSESFSDTEYEPNNAIGEATTIPVGFDDGNLFVVSTTQGTLGDEDWFSFTLDKTTQVAINLLTDTIVDATLYDAGENLIQTLTSENDPILVPGTYFIQVSTTTAAKYGLSVSVK